MEMLVEIVRRKISGEKGDRGGRSGGEEGAAPREEVKGNVGTE